jgi:hypothetical protein
VPHDTAEIALYQAFALCNATVRNATVREPDLRRCEALADRIGELLKRHDTADITLVHANSIRNALG